MLTPMLACGPFFREDGLAASLVLFLLVKPLAYFAFIQAFRYRVSRPIPMRFSQAVKLTAMRAGLGLAIVGAGALLLNFVSRGDWWLMSWIGLYGERIFSWWLVGSWGAGLVGRRLIGWISSGTLINVAFDFGMVAGLFDGWIWPVLTTAAVAAFIAALHVVGRRQSLRLRFASGSVCAGCGYDLTGNLSGRCPECGRSIEAAPLAASA